MKPFNIELAKAGNPVCTRDGRKARIVCFDRNAAEYHIVALIECKGFPNKEEEIKVYNNAGKYFANRESSYDLMIAPVKKTGWINIYNDTPIFDTQDHAELNASDTRKRIATVQIEWEE